MADVKDIEKFSTSTGPLTPEDDDTDLESLRPIETNNVRPACFKTTFQEILFVLTATMAIAMSAFLTGSVTVTSSLIGRALNMTVAELTWINSATSLSSGAFLLFFGRVADMFGRKFLFVGSLFFFSVFCLAAGFSDSAITIDVLCGVLGLFGASAVPPAVGILGIIYEKPSKRKNYAFACFSAGNPLGFVFGTIFGGVAAELFGWRASFWLIAIIIFAFTFIAMFSVPRDFTEKEPLTWASIKRFDIVGTILTVAGILLFSAGLTLGGTAPKGWSTGYVIAFLIVGVALMVAFVCWESWFSAPLVPMGIWKDRNFSIVLSILTLGFMAFAPVSFFIALYFQNVWHMSAIMVAVHLLPMAINGIIVNIFAAFALHRISNKTLMYIGAAAYVIADLLFALNRHSASYWAFCFPALTLLVVGADLEFNVANMYVMSSMPPSQQSIAGGIFQTVTKLCMTLGFGLATAVFNAVEKDPNLARYWDAGTQPYAATFWVSVACSVLSLCLVPFLTIGTQGGKDPNVREDASGSTNSEDMADERPQSAKGEAVVAQALPVHG